MEITGRYAFKCILLQRINYAHKHRWQIFPSVAQLDRLTGERGVYTFWVAERDESIVGLNRSTGPAVTNLDPHELYPQMLRRGGAL